MINILFIGNSFTFYHDMPLLCQKMLLENGVEANVQSVTRSGAFLWEYADPGNPLGNKLREVYSAADWDYIVLQDQSANPAINEKVFQKSVDDLTSLLQVKRSFLFYQTWTYHADCPKLANTGLDQETLYQRLKDAYSLAAKRHHALLVPVGDVFKAKGQDASLYAEDLKHPSELGSTIAARCFCDEFCRDLRNRASGR